MDIKKIIERAKKEILSDIKKGVIPKFPNSFSHLHDFVDANYYGGFLEENYIISTNFEVENTVQTALDGWLKQRYVNWTKRT